MHAFLRQDADPDFDLQQPMEAAVVMPTVLRPSIVAALRSVFAQTVEGRIHILVGIDAPLGDMALLDQALLGRPPNMAVQLFYPGFSTSVRHGGLSPARDGGALRTVLSQLANSPYVAYLDDDNWWGPDHLAQLCSALRDGEADCAFAHSLRWFVHPDSLRPVCVDAWESVGVGAGIFAQRFNGFIDPNCLMIDKRVCPEVLALWQVPLAGDPKAMSADRTVFTHLQSQHRGIGTGQPSSFYRLDPTDGLHGLRMQLFGAQYEQAALFA